MSAAEGYCRTGRRGKGDREVGEVGEVSSGDGTGGDNQTAAEAGRDEKEEAEEVSQAEEKGAPPKMSDLIHWSVAVTTAPRSQPTLTDTLLSLRDAGWDAGANVFVDSDMQFGPYGNLRRAAVNLLILAMRLQRTGGEPDAYLICQDDIQLTRGLRQHLEADSYFRKMLFADELLKKPVGVISLYCAGPNDSPAGGWHSIDDLPTAAYGALAYVFTRDSMLEFLRWICPNDRAPADWVMGCFCKDVQRDYVTHSPSFVRHTGETSSLPNPCVGHDPSYRQCREFLEYAKADFEPAKSTLAN
jgi:hypothetical protein